MRHASEMNISNIKTHHAALRLVSTKDMSREDWLAIRKQGIGASDAAAAVGLNPYQSPLELWMIKTGRDGDMPKLIPTMKVPRCTGATSSNPSWRSITAAYW
jgi:hypothetical protein